MKKLLLTILFIGTFGLVFGQTEFITVWKTDEQAGVSGGNPISSATQVKLPISGSGITYSGSWTKVGDASKNGSFTNATLTNHVVEFGEEGNFEVIISAVTGANFAWRFGGTTAASDCKKFMEVKQWGSLWTFTGGNIFRGCEKMQVTATDAPLLSGDIGSMFMGCTALTGNNSFNNWNLSNVTNLNQLFRDCTNFNAPINNWVTSEVTAMNNMFQGATNFDQPIGNWNTAKVNNMASMFQNATNFNRPLNSWNTALVTSMANMFQSATNFDQPIGNWNTAIVSSMANMFNGVSSFNQSLATDGNKWNVEKVESMQNMFRSATMFNQPLNSWNTAALTNITSMFQGANGTTRNSFNQPLNNWNTEKITNMNSAFRDSDFDNPSLASWSLKGKPTMEDFFRANNNVGISCVNLSLILAGWANNDETPNGITIGAAYRKFGDQTAYNTLVGKGWVFYGTVIGTPATNGPTYDATCATTLPVTFGSITASISGNNLLVQWQTISETNNDYFLVLASTDGKTWTEQAKIASKAIVGNSSVPLNYEYSGSYDNTVQLASLSILGVLALALLFLKRGNKLIVSSAALLFIGVFISSCNKNDLADNYLNTEKQNKGKAIYVKIVQVDKDGTNSGQSEVIIAKSK